MGLRRRLVAQRLIAGAICVVVAVVDGTPAAGAARVTAPARQQPSCSSPSEENYAYDGAGNRTQAGTLTYTYDARNRLTSDSTASYTWSPRGTLSSVVRGANTATVEHDAFGRMASYGATTYAFDSLDRMTTRGAESFSYAGTEFDPVANGTNKYGRTPTGELTSLKGGLLGMTSALVGKNRHGDLAWLADASGSVTDTRIYEPFGVVAGSTGTTNPQVGFQGDYTDPVSGNVWMYLVWLSFVRRRAPA